MKVSLPQKTLAAALAHGAVVAPKTATIPALTHVRLKAEGDSLAIASTDLDRFAEADCPAEVSEPGAVIVPAAAFVTLISTHAKSNAVSLETDGHSLVVKSGRSKVKLPTLPANDFPTWAEAAAVAEFTLGGDQFRRSIGRVRFAASEETARYYLQGVFLDAEPGGEALHFVATDGHRLARSTIAMPEGAEDCPPAIIPSEGLDAALRVFKNAAEIHVRVTAAAVRFEVEGVRLATKLIDGTFPDYRRVIPAPHECTLKASRAEFVDCLDRANAIAGEGSIYGAVVLQPLEGGFSLRAINEYGAEAVEECAAVIAPGFERVGFNPRYAAQFLATLTVDDIVVEQSAHDGPHRITSPQAPDFTGVLMPMRISAK